MRLSKARKACVTAMMKETIFEAANTVLEQHGTGGLTMDRVAATVGVATGSLYNYFADKDEFLCFFFSRLAEPFFRAIEETAGAELPATEKLEKILRTAWEHTNRHKGLIRLLAGVDRAAQLRKDVRPRLVRAFSAIFEQGIQEGTYRPHNSLYTGSMLYGCLLELFELQAEGASNETIEGYVGVLIDTVLHGFTLPAEKRFGAADSVPSVPGPLA